MQDQNSDKANSAPVLYLPHGGGPLPILGAQNHQPLVEFLRSIPTQLGSPSAILVVSAHWEATRPTITYASQPDLIYDYNGFPAEAYEIQYPAPGHPKLAEAVFELLEKAELGPYLDDSRGFDHGMFIPLKLMYPNADIPCIQLSLLTSLDPFAHIAMGKALATLREQNVLIIGSGLSYHNMQGFMNSDPADDQDNLAFDHWLVETCAKTCTNSQYSEDERERQLIGWRHAPGALASHPREEHLLPLHVCYGAASQNVSSAKLVFHDVIMSKVAVGLLWQ